MAKMANKNCKRLVSGRQYQGKYVAFTSSGRKSIVASGSNLNTVVKKAQQHGVDAPAIVFVPKRGVTCLY